MGSAKIIIGNYTLQQITGSIYDVQANIIRDTPSQIKYNLVEVPYGKQIAIPLYKTIRTTEIDVSIIGVISDVISACQSLANSASIGKVQFKVIINEQERINYPNAAVTVDILGYTAFRGTGGRITANVKITAMG